MRLSVPVAVAALLAGAGLISAVAAPERLVVNDFVSTDGISAAPWPDADDAKPTSKISIGTVDGGPGHPSALKLQYDFPSERCTQVRIDLPVPACENYARLTLAVQGDGSGNVLEVWTGEQARGWRGVGSLPLNFTDWREVTLKLDDNFTVLAETLRLIVRRAGALGPHTVYLDDPTFVSPVDKPLPASFVFGTAASGLPPFQRAKAFRLEKRRVGNKTVALLDGEPLACVVDAAPTPEYLELARRAGSG